jgi:CubicO group peptidase (beta-lactamase class C family)
MKLPAAVALFALAATTARADALDDAVKGFAKPDAPGCAIGVAEKGKAPVFRAWGLAELEHKVPITPETVFEAGSVSKQFTAAAVLLLVQDGKLELADDIRKYLPEMPSYGAPITVDHLLNHTSGLRDWGEVAAVAGWPRGSRAYSNLEALKIASRQKALNYPTGSAYSYTNTGYNLAAVIVSRVSGQSFADFSRERLFKPLGMTRTQWRDDFRRVVPGRAQAYEPAPGGYHLAMPFEHVHGNGGLLTTVGDLVLWDAAIAAGRLGPAITAQLHEQATLTGGRKIEYARGLFIGSYKGVPSVSHSGATGGYRAWLGRYPAQGVTVAMLCNGADTPGDVPLKISDLYLPPSPRPDEPVTQRVSLAAGAPAMRVAPEELSSRPGVYVSDGALQITRVVADGAGLKIQGGPAIQPDGPGRYKAGASELVFRADGALERRTPDGEVTLHRRQESGWQPTAAELAELAGTYVSDEAETRIILSARDGRLTVVSDDRPGSPAILSPIFKDGFTRPGSLLRVLRDKSGRVEGLRYQGGRVWDLRLRQVS